MDNTNLKRKKLNYAWVIVGICALMVCIVLGFCSSSKSLYTKAITDSLGISRSSFSVNDSCRYITTSIVNLFFGFLIAKFGAKKLIAAGFACLISSCLIYSLATNVYVFYIGGALLGMGLSWTTTTMVGYVVNKWCSSNRGTIMGAILASNGIGAAVATMILSPVINRSVYGYRDAYRLVAIILLVVFVLVMIFFKNSPKDAKEDTANVPKKKGRGQSWEGIEYSVVVKRAYFYSALICVFLTGMMLQGITGISTPHMYDRGLDEGYVALVLSAHSLALTLFKFLTGFMYDRFGLRVTSNICMVTAVVTFLFLANVTESTTGRAFAMIYGVFSSLSLPLETIMLPIYASDLFGEKSFSKILGLFVSVNTAGYALGAPVSNLCFDITGSYNVALYISALLMIGVIIVMNTVISVSNKQRKLIEAKADQTV
ncbi:MAG: MFS transporter [Clostridia bacterium]|nr:MFS transporter [Clostridia bacterium]